MSKYFQGKYVPKNPKKYAGNVSEIFARSSWERRMMVYFDTNPNVLKWSSEEVVLKYVSPLDNRIHRYYVDFAAMIQNKHGEVKKYLIEVKPLKETMPPQKKARNTQRYLTEVSTYLVNQKKWEAAREFCAKNGWEFEIITERHLGI